MGGMLVDSPARRLWLDSKEGQRLFKLHCVCIAIVGFGARHRSRTAAKAGRCSSRTSSRQPAALVVDASTRPLNKLCRRIPSFHTSPLSPIIPAVKSPGVICRLSPVATSARERIPTSMIFTRGLSHAWRRDTITLLEIQIAVYSVQPGGVRLDENLLSPAPKVFGDNVNVPPRMQSMQAADVIAPQSSGCREIRLERLPNARIPQGLAGNHLRREHPLRDIFAHAIRYCVIDVLRIGPLQNNRQ